MRPLFPIPRRRDYRLDSWGSAGHEIILVFRDMARPPPWARRFLDAQLQVGGTGCVAPRERLDSDYAELVVRAWLAAYARLFKGVQIDESDVSAEYLNHFLLRDLARESRWALAEWLDRLIVDPPGALVALRRFGPQAYVAAMCAVFGACHPWSHLGEAGDARARDAGFLPPDEE
ncbi:MAG: hypothetical protein AB7P08_10380 [Burkholderiales bacterium]